MEVAVRLLGVILRLLNFILTPLFWLRDLRPRSVSAPPALLLRSAVDLAEAIRNGELSSVHLVATCIERVKEVNPLINAVVDERFTAALEDAKEADRQVEEARRSGTLDKLAEDKPLLGLPFTVKESCSLAGLSNAVGCVSLAGRRAAADGAAVGLARAAGAVPLLVSNTPELCLGWETTNLLTGTTNNPYNLNCTPGGSSGGECALVASGAAAFGVASDIAGSIRVPAAFCGIFGHKPTPGVVPIAGHVPQVRDPLCARLLALGPVARRARDLPLVLHALAAPPHRARLRLQDPVRIDRLKVYYMTELTKSIAMLGVDKKIKEMIVNSAKYLEKECGATLSEEKFEGFDDAVEMSVSVFFSMNDIPNMLHDPANPKCDKSIVVELIKYAFGGGTTSLQGLGFALLNKTKLFIPESRRAYYCKKAEELRKHITGVLGPDGVLVTAAWPGVAHPHGALAGRAAGVAHTMVVNVLGLPATAVPLPASPLPLALQVIAAPYQDRLCLAVARQLEIGFGGWRPPQ